MRCEVPPIPSIRWRPSGAARQGYNVRWTTETAQDGAGVTFDEFIAGTRASLEAYGLVADLDIFKPRTIRRDSGAGPTAADRGRTERPGHRARLFRPGRADGRLGRPHISPIATYDVDLRHVLIMDVGRQWYIPYWSSDEKLLAAMLRPAPAKYGRAGGADRRSRSGQIEDGSMKLVECDGARLHPRLSRNAERAARSQNQFKSIKARRLSRPAPRLATAAGTTDATASRQPHSSHSS